MDFVNILGALVSTIGLGISIWIITITTGARKAAQEARIMIYRNNLLNELREIKYTIVQFQNEIDKGNRGLLNYLILKSIDQVNVFKSKWIPELKDRGNISFMNEELETLSKFILKINSTSLDPKQKDRLYISTATALKYINDEMGFWERNLSGAA